MLLEKIDATFCQRSEHFDCPKRRRSRAASNLINPRKKGEIMKLMADFRTVQLDQKKEVGVKINELKNAALEEINGLKEQMEEAEASSDDIESHPYRLP